jgi:hypothetical protein
MLDRVLGRAGFRDIPGTAGREARLDATRRLMASFQGGMTSETALVSSLETPTAIEKAPVESIGYDIAAKIFAEHFRIKESPAPTRKGYQYGKRIEVDGRWTIYHVFTGVPAQFGPWEMVHLNESTARRTLNTLNAPERDE